tara:strand:- start:762 stop:1220 length:459 start_codon:yes stop_codon:yes gene_type:complete
MKLVILAVGKGRSAPEAMLADSWVSRIPSGGGIIEVDSKLPAGPDRQRDESARLLRHIDAGIPLAACDPRGRNTSSEALAALIVDWRDAGHNSAFFAIGGADGHAAALTDRADRMISFGSATWPHMLFRAMLAEQLYRATTILAGHPYHRSG